MPPYSGFKPLVGGGAQRPAPAARPIAHTRTGLSASATAANSASDPLHERSSTPALRSTFVDKEEAAMLRAMARLNGNETIKRTGNSYSQANRAKIKARADEAAALGLVPLDPKEQHELSRRLQAGYTSMSERAVTVPKVGRPALRERPTPVECVPHRRNEQDIRLAHDNFSRPSAPRYKPFESADDKKDALALRNQFNGRTPQEVISADAQPAAPPQVSRQSSLREQIVDEIAERHEFLEKSEICH